MKWGHIMSVHIFQYNFFNQMVYISFVKLFPNFLSWICGFCHHVDALLD